MKGYVHEKNALKGKTFKIFPHNAIHLYRQTLVFQHMISKWNNEKQSNKGLCDLSMGLDISCWPRHLK